MDTRFYFTNQAFFNVSLKFPKTTETKIPDSTGLKIPRLGLAC